MNFEIKPFIECDNLFEGLGFTNSQVNFLFSVVWKSLGEDIRLSIDVAKEEEKRGEFKKGEAVFSYSELIKLAGESFEELTHEQCVAIGIIIQQEVSKAQELVAQAGMFGMIGMEKFVNSIDEAVEYYKSQM